MRTCARVAVDDCKEVYGVMYCYCRHNLCNSPDRKLADPPKTHHHRQHPKDTSTPSDYDSSLFEGGEEEEGSGGGGDMYNYDGESNHDLFDYGDDDDDDSNYRTDYSDGTEPPPAIKQELEDEYKKIEKELLDNNFDIEFDEETNYIESRRDKNQLGSAAAAAPAPEISGSQRNSSVISSIGMIFFCMMLAAASSKIVVI